MCGVLVILNYFNVLREDTLITSFFWKGSDQEAWKFEKAYLRKVNLFVGKSGSGKSRLLNVIFNFAAYVSRGEPFRDGTFDIELNINGYIYNWFYEAVTKDGVSIVMKEKLTRKSIDGADERIIVDRDDKKFLFFDKELPKLDKNKPSVNILKNEDDIEPIYNAFSRVKRRNFHDEGLKDVLSIQNVPAELENEYKKHGFNAFITNELTISAKLYLLKTYHNNIYKKITSSFSSVFPEIEEFNIKNVSLPIATQQVGKSPLFFVKEKNVKNEIPVIELSSGMQKVLLIIVDILTLPDSSLYIIDEYENSLGVNAIDFLPSFILDNRDDLQYIITTHHPYLINSMPIKNWRLFSRKGSSVSIADGKYIEEKYGKSKQQAFIKLLNDPLYSGEIQ